MLKNLAVQRIFHFPSQLSTSYCGLIPSDEIGADLADVFHEVLYDLVLFRRFGLQFMSVVIAEDVIQPSSPIQSLTNS